jgi:hypothetical protein
MAERLHGVAAGIVSLGGRLVQAVYRRRRIATNYFVLEPEVAGWFGPATTGNLQVRPPQIEKFNYEFDTWLGDPLLEALTLSW